MDCDEGFSVNAQMKLTRLLPVTGHHVQTLPVQKLALLHDLHVYAGHQMRPATSSSEQLCDNCYYKCSWYWMEEMVGYNR